MVRTFLPSMIKRNSGHIVAISSITALSGVPKLSTYSACTSGIKGKLPNIGKNSTLSFSSPNTENRYTVE